MDNKIVSTTYVPLQPPYQIIKYGNDIGMQIGTLIATEQTDGEENSPFRIATHSYPVVTYGSKESAPKDKHLFEKDYTEGVVWNRVETRYVGTICLSDSHLPWQEFIDFLWTDINRISYQSAPYIRALHAISDLGVKIDPLPPGPHVLHIQTYCGDEVPTMVRTDRDDALALNVLLRNDVNAMAEDIEFQIIKYEAALSIIPQFSGSGKWKVKFVTDEEMLKPLVERLNIPRTVMLDGKKYDCLISAIGKEQAED